MGNECDYKGKHLVLQPVPRSEFEALTRGSEIIQSFRMER
jgi:hypothetical protein